MLAKFLFFDLQLDSIVCHTCEIKRPSLDERAKIEILHRYSGIEVYDTVGLATLCRRNERDRNS